MHSRYLLIATAAFALTTNAMAEPAKPAPQPAAQSTERRAEILMASAEQVQTPAPIAANAPEGTPAKRPRAARVTTCRCAGQNQP